MAKVIIIAFIVAVVVAVMANPVDEQSDYQVVEFEHHLRLPRATCDLLSAFGAADSACAAHCLVTGYRGGWCDKGVCHCRR
ncbi:defensin-like [Hyposmocoma kahamanoa]|uniref:defensin-like n=1 Tax=Hyposmocoma kahamanoa TaxID=1477025 RepID=UPI000E6D85D1|nr:defensin-like [Hyposmocoma kahamanoa]